MTTGRVFLSGPITGIPNLNQDAFLTEQARLWVEGCDVFSPLSVPRIAVNEHWQKVSEQEEWAYYMRQCIKALLVCDSVRFLPGWQNSKGACLQHKIAVALGMEISYCPVPEE